MMTLGFPGGAVVKNLSANTRVARDVGSIPGSERYEVGNGNPLWYSYLENFMGKGAWPASMVAPGPGSGAATALSSSLKNIFTRFRILDCKSLSFIALKLPFQYFLASIISVRRQ